MMNADLVSCHVIVLKARKRRCIGGFAYRSNSDFLCYTVTLVRYSIVPMKLDRGCRCCTNSRGSLPWQFDPENGGKNEEKIRLWLARGK